MHINDTTCSDAGLRCRLLRTTQPGAMCTHHCQQHLVWFLPPASAFRGGAEGYDVWGGRECFRQSAGGGKGFK